MICSKGGINCILQGKNAQFGEQKDLCCNKKVQDIDGWGSHQYSVIFLKLTKNGTFMISRKTTIHCKQSTHGEGNVA